MVEPAKTISLKVGQVKNKMQNKSEEKRPVAGENTQEFKPERQYILRYLTKFLGVNFLWFLAFFVVVLVSSFFHRI